MKIELTEKETENLKTKEKICKRKLSQWKHLCRIPHKL